METVIDQGLLGAVTANSFRYFSIRKNVYVCRYILTDTELIILMVISKDLSSVTNLFTGTFRSLWSHLFDDREP